MASPEAMSAIDINCGGGETIKAAHSGTVTFAGLDPRTADDSSTGYGWMVKIEDAAYPEYETRYGHMGAGSLMVSTGDHVTAGVTGLGLCGNPTTGNSSGPHLHFELRHNGVTLCPCIYLSGGC
jgi:murein DD-endopeptidase MepM/ murein hydrolase activator NlpD